jgi:hypothetical protein
MIGKVNGFLNSLILFIRGDFISSWDLVIFFILVKRGRAYISASGDFLRIGLILILCFMI